MPGTGGPGYCIKGEFATNPRNSHVDGALPWHAPWTPIPRVRSSTSAWAPSITSVFRLHRLWYHGRGSRCDSQLRAGDEIVHVEIVHE